MSKFKGTKKDWHAIEFAGIIILKDSEFYEGKNIIDYDDVGKEVADANAKLAVCAPELLDALKHTLEILDLVEGNSHLLETISNAYSNYFNLIQKATS